MGESLVGHLPSKQNVAGLMTKVLDGDERRYLVSNILYDVHDKISIRKRQNAYRQA